MQEFNTLNLVALVWFILLWTGYTLFANWFGKRRHCLASQLHAFRLSWMRNLLLRDNRVPDTTIVANLERSVTFFASSTLLVIAGAITVLASSDKAIAIVSDLPWVQDTSQLGWDIKLISIVVMFVFAFFKFTWSLRQVGFCSVLIGAAPLPSDSRADSEKEAYAAAVADVLSLAGYQFNLGLRSYYFGLASLAWFINPGIFMVATAGVVCVLYFREFHSGTLHALIRAGGD